MQDIVPGAKIEVIIKYCKHYEELKDEETLEGAEAAEEEGGREGVE